MKHLSGFLLFVILLLSGYAANASPLTIVAEDVKGRPVKDVRFSSLSTGEVSAPTTAEGRTKVSVKATKPGETVELKVSHTRGQRVERVLIDPWNGRVTVPAGWYTKVVLVQRGDREALESGDFAKAMAQRILAEVNKVPDTQPPAVPTNLQATAVSSSQINLTWTASTDNVGVAGYKVYRNGRLIAKTQQQVTEEQRRNILAEEAARVGLKPEEIDQAIRSWKDRAKDPYDIGIAALYERNYPQATEQLRKSLKVREEQEATSREKVADAAYFLGQAQYEQGQYAQAADQLSKGFRAEAG